MTIPNAGTRYREVGECYDDFAGYLGITKPRFFWDVLDRGWVMHRFDPMTFEDVCGKPMSTKKEAKASYKEALRKINAEKRSIRNSDPTLLGFC